MSDYDWRHFDQNPTLQPGPPAEPDDPPPAAQHARPQEADTGPLPRADIAAAAELADPAEQQGGPAAPPPPPPAGGADNRGASLSAEAFPPRSRPEPPRPRHSARPVAPRDWGHSADPAEHNGSGDKNPSALLDRLSPETLAPPRKPQPSRGWRHALLKSTGGLVNPGLSTYEEKLREDVQTIRGLLRGDCYRIGVFVGKGGTGKSTIATCIASIFAEFRADDRVVAVDADPSFGKLADRIAPATSQTFWDLLGDEANGRLKRWTDVKAHLGSNSETGLWLLRGEHRTQRRRLIDADTYSRAMQIIERYMNIAVIDCGQVLEHDVMQAVLPTLNAAIVVGAIEPGAGLAAGETLAWLGGAGYHRLMRNAVVVLNDPRGRASKQTRASLLRDFTAHADGPTVVMPFDGHLSAGGVIDTKAGVGARTRRASIEIAAHVAREFAGTALESGRR